jgi:1,4-dihydroxy-2-naphthoate octaprenyltransferase
MGLLPWVALLPWLSLPLAVKLAWVVFTQTGQALNVALAGTGQLALAFSVLFLLGMLLAG